MSALNYILLDQQVLLATDSLASDLDKSPRSFQTKVFPLPHLNAVIAGTGIFQLLLDWYVFAQSRLVVRDVMFLSQMAAEHLPTLAAPYLAPGLGSSTIYHFGYDESLRHFRGFAHRSDDGFVLEEFERPRWALKPGSPELLQQFEAVFRATNDPTTSFVEAVRGQRAADLRSPLSERVGIGGEVHLMELTPGSQFIWRCYRFDDYDRLFGEMVAKLKAP